MRAFWILMWVGCNGSDDDDNDGGIYDSCVEADECDAPDGLEPTCLEKGSEGYCTHTCAVDDDCLGVNPERVCASFESNAELYCFPSCEDGDDTCPPTFGCRSTGGGSSNRKVCFPE